MNHYLVFSAQDIRDALADNVFRQHGIKICPKGIILDKDSASVVIDPAILSQESKINERDEDEPLLTATVVVTRQASQEFARLDFCTSWRMFSSLRWDCVSQYNGSLIEKLDPAQIGLKLRRALAQRPELMSTGNLLTVEPSLIKVSVNKNFTNDQAIKAVITCLEEFFQKKIRIK